MRDVRARIAGNEVLFDSPNETRIDDEPYCINAEQGYKPNSVGTQISDALAQHLRQRGSLRAVSVGRRVEDAFYLSGTLRRFYAAQKSTSMSPTTGALFGVVGVAIASATTPDETPGTVAIEIVDWVLYDNSGKPVAKLPNIVYRQKLSLPAATNCLVVYRNANERLRQVFNEYVFTIESAIADVVRGAKPNRLGNVATASPAGCVAQPAPAADRSPFEPPPEEPW